MARVGETVDLTKQAGRIDIQHHILQDRDWNGQSVHHGQQTIRALKSPDPLPGLVQSQEQKVTPEAGMMEVPTSRHTT
ncbi:MAG: hypothetical protein NVS2B7_28340 [Herpetosiphon sp.]